MVSFLPRCPSALSLVPLFFPYLFLTKFSSYPNFQVVSSLLMANHQGWFDPIDSVFSASIGEEALRQLGFRRVRLLHFEPPCCLQVTLTAKERRKEEMMKHHANQPTEMKVQSPRQLRLDVANPVTPNILDRLGRAALPASETEGSSSP